LVPAIFKPDLLLYKHHNNLILHTYPPVKMELAERPEPLANKLQAPANYSEESIQCLEHGKSLKSRT
jgi:hypothetical protein